MFNIFKGPTKVALDTQAPTFELFDHANKLQRLADYSGKWLVLYFYPRDDTPGCTKEACSFRDDIHKIRELNAVIIGISTDNIERHAAFVKKYTLPFSLLADIDAKVAREYGAVWKIGPLKITKRRSFIISPTGKILKVYRKVNPDKHSNQIIADLKSLQAAN